MLIQVHIITKVYLQKKGYQNLKNKKMITGKGSINTNVKDKKQVKDAKAKTNYYNVYPYNIKDNDYFETGGQKC